MGCRPAILAITLLVGCAPNRPPVEPAPRDAMSVRASFGRTWDATVEYFARQNEAIRVMERASGFIATEKLSLRAQYDDTYVDCGTEGQLRLEPTHVTYNVLVRGDSSDSTLRVSARWELSRLKNPVECATRYRLEQGIEGQIKAAAESAIVRRRS